MWFLAIRHLTSRQRQTIITISGVALGVSAFVAFSNIMLGFQEYIINQLVNNDSHVRISKREENIEEHSMDKIYYPDAEHVFWIKPPSGNRDATQIENPLAWFERLKRDPRVLAYSSQLQTQVFYTYGGVTRAGKMIGSDPHKQIRISNIRDYMKQGDFLKIGASGNKIVAGDSLLKKMGARVGDSLLISTGKRTGIPFKIIGAFHFGIMGLDDTVTFGALSDVQNVNLTPSQISDIALRLTDVNMASEFATDYSQFSKDKVQSWDQANANILSVFTMQNMIRNFITTSIMIVAAFGIYNILNILVNQKRKDIGILRSMGFDGPDIRNLFLIQGLILGTCGGAIGLLVGHGISLFMGTLQIGGMIDRMIISYNPQIYIMGFVVATLASAFSSFLPARAAGKLKPIDIVRSGE